MKPTVRFGSVPGAARGALNWPLALGIFWRSILALVYGVPMVISHPKLGFMG